MSRELDVAEALRIDRWLWCARLFRARTRAADAVKGGHVRVNGRRVKASHALKIGDEIRILRGETEQALKVLALAERRGPAAEAAELYEETPESLAERQAAAERRRFAYYDAPTRGRPDKLTRRLIRNKRRGEGDR